LTAADDRISAMHPAPTWRLGHVIIPVSRATWSDSVEHLSLDVRGEFIEYLMGRPSLSGTISVGTERPVDRIGRRVQLPVREDDDLSLYTGMHVRPKALALTIEEVEGPTMRARLDGIADVEWDDLLGRDVPFTIEGWFGPDERPGWWPKESQG
jgi:hypothetical protein